MRIVTLDPRSLDPRLREDEFITRPGVRTPTPESRGRDQRQTIGVDHRVVRISYRTQ